MSNTRQVMQQALRALEKAQVRADMYAVDNAIDALRAALAEPEQKLNFELPPGFEFQPAFVPRKPLTDEEIDRVTQQQWGEMRVAPLFGARLYARAIERAHGIGEGQ